MNMLKESSIRGIFKDHHSSKRLLFLAVSKKVSEILVVNFCQSINLSNTKQHCKKAFSIGN